MPDFGIYAGDTNKTIYVRLRDSTTGLAKTGLAYNSAGASCYYVLPGAAEVQITLATQTVTGAHSDGGFVEVDATNNKGLYRLDLSDAAIASGDYSLISIEFDGTIEETVIIPLHTRKVNTVEIGGTTQTANDVGGDVDAILADTNELQGDWTNGGRLDVILDAIKAVTDNHPDSGAFTTIDANVDAILVDTGTTIPGLISGLNDISVGDITGATVTELTSVPAASPTLIQALALLYMALRNKIDVTATTKEVHNDAGTVLGTKSLSDDGTTYSEAKMS